MLYERAKKEVEAISEQISSIKCQLEAFPPGKLICCNHKTHTKWYHKNQEQKSYIPKAKTDKYFFVNVDMSTEYSSYFVPVVFTSIFCSPFT